MADLDLLARRRHGYTALAVLAAVAIMIGLSYAAVPLYRVFCRATGYGGTPQVAASAPRATGQRVVNVHFDANVAPGLPWSFEPEQAQVDVRTGTTTTVYYRIRNLSGRPTAANAQYNITPEVGGFFFNKIACFCFDEQRLGPNETQELPVVFFLDPALDKDPTMKNVDTLTLSYTLYAAKQPAVAAGTGPSGAPSGRSKL